MSSTSAAEFLTESDAPGAADDAVFTRLEADFGDELKAVLALYLENSDALCQRLEEAMTCAYWQEAVRAALEIGREAEGLGFRRVAAAARKLADAAYRADSAEALRNDAQMVMLEYERFRLALAARFPNLVASMVDSVA
ncbi:hypothetical protein [Rhizomicrobium electricum]|jgi:hypothetical protein|uniref:Hpt domain-containing protein n=1 Tax=Rhizomicrobium electricum TaxID=480070 RepID=A0ABP3QE07_9PROT|nr:hypothetical protein [Rhizomicrobium electricum]NIJ50581.1 hypothetical protein [Rhizomicrobium electricum]